MNIRIGIDTEATYEVRETIQNRITSALPGPKTTLTLKKMTETLSADKSTIDTAITVQTVNAVLQPMSDKDKISYGRQASEKIFRAFIAYSEFTSQVNSQYLDTLNQMTATINGVSKTFEIISSELKGAGSLCKHFDVLMKVVE